jgi:alcohol dehydrogenase
VIPFRSPVPRFLAGGDLFVGDGALIALRALVGTRVYVVHAPSVGRDPGLLAAIEKSAAAPRIEFRVWSGGEPRIAEVRELAAAMRAARPDVIVAVGGGSVIDAARAAWLLYEHPSLGLGVEPRVAVPALRGLARFAAVPTTAGAGSEVSSAVVLADEGGQKVILVSGEFLPDIVILDPRASQTVPAAVLQRSLCDVLAHMVEGHCSRIPNAFVAELTRQAFPSLWAALTRDAESLEAPAERLRLMQLSLQGGWVQNHRPPGLGHAVAHALSRVGLTHAVASGLCLAPALQQNAVYGPTRTALTELAASVGLPDADALISAVDQRARKLVGPQEGLRERIRAAATLVGSAMADVTARSNPVSVTEAMVEHVLEAIA